MHWHCCWHHWQHCRPRHSLVLAAMNTLAPLVIGMSALALLLAWAPAICAAPDPAAECGGHCLVTAGHDAVSSGIIVPPIQNATVQSCCEACKANPRCEAFVTGPCNAEDPVCKHWPDPTVNACYLVHGYRGLKAAGGRDRTTGCVRGGVRPAPPSPPVKPLSRLALCGARS